METLQLEALSFFSLMRMDKSRVFSLGLCMQLDRVGHDFFVFQEEQTKQVQVVYRRREEGYGVIIPHVLPSPEGA